MNNIISKELLEEVLDKKLHLEHLWELNKNNEFLYYEGENGDGKHINIYELAYKCKEWALQQKPYYEIESRIVANNTGGYDSLPVAYACVIFDDMPLREIKAPTEPEAIFKACQWILENKDK